MRFRLLMIVLGLWAWAGPAPAQEGAPEVRAAEIAAGARREVVVMAAYLRSRAVAESLRQAALAGVQVRLISSAYTYLDPSSYFLGLYLAGAELWLGYPDEYLMVVDGRAVYAGRGIGHGGEAVRRLGEAEARARLEKLRRAFGAATSFAYSPEEIARYLIGRGR